MKKSVLAFWMILTSFVVTLISFVSAQTLARYWGTNFAEGLKAFYETIPLFSPDMISKLLLGALLWMIVYAVVVQLFNAKERTGRWFASAIALIITLLAFIALPPGFVGAIVIQYGIMGATILSLIPFLIILYFSLSVTESLFVARVVWIFYIVYYLAIFGYKLSTLYVGQAKWIDYIPYGAAVVAGLIVFFALPVIRKLVFHGELEALGEKGDKIAKRAKMLHNLQSKELRESYGG